MFISLNVNEVARLAFLSAEETEAITIRLSERKELNVRIDRQTQTYYFEESPSLVNSDPAATQEQLDALLGEMTVGCLVGRLLS